MLKTWCTAAIGVLALSTALAAQRPTTTTAVPLVVVVDDAAGRRITSDTQGPYIDGQQGVAATLDKYGNLIVDFQTGKTAVRKLYFDYGGPLDGQQPGAVIAPPNNYLSTLAAAKIQEMAIDDIQCVRANVTHTSDDGKTEFRLLFQREIPNTEIEVTNTAYLVVTRTPDTVEGKRTWSVDSVEAAGCQSGEPGAARLVDTPLVGKFRFTDRGRYDMSLRLLLIEK